MLKDHLITLCTCGYYRITCVCVDGDFKCLLLDIIKSLIIIFDKINK